MCLSRSYILSKRINISSNFLHLQVATLFLFLHTKRYSNILTETTPTGASNARGVGRNWDSDPISCFIAYCELCDGQLLSTRLPADTVPCYRSMPAGTIVLSTDGGPSSGVSQTVTVQVFLQHRKPRTNEYAEEKTREHNLLYAAVNLTREYN